MGIPTLLNAQTLTTTQKLDFGESVITENDRRYAMNVNSNGSFLSDPAFVVLRIPNEGVYQVTGLPPSTMISAIKIRAETQLLGPGQDFIIDSFDVDAPDRSDVNGELIIRIGARLQTSGTGVAYTQSAQYDSNINVEIEF